MFDNGIAEAAVEFVHIGVDVPGPFKRFMWKNEYPL